VASPSLSIPAISQFHRHQGLRFPAGLPKLSGVVNVVHPDEGVRNRLRGDGPDPEDDNARMAPATTWRKAKPQKQLWLGAEAFVFSLPEREFLRVCLDLNEHCFRPAY
jgi:hypothetical protein